jgi:hypothetical protein
MMAETGPGRSTDAELEDLERTAAELLAVRTEAGRAELQHLRAAAGSPVVW